MLIISAIFQGGVITAESGKLYVIDPVFSINYGWLGVIFLPHYCGLRSYEVSSIDLTGPGPYSILNLRGAILRLEVNYEQSRDEEFWEAR
jgi:hypothetical protein